MAKEFFEKHNIAFTNYNVSSDPERRSEMMQKSGQMGVPTIFIDNEMIVGFDKARIKSLLEIT